MNDHDDGGWPPKKPKKPNKYATAPYEVGKGKPPLRTRFKAGQPSANPRGRPKGSKNKNFLEKLLDRKVPAGTKNGRMRKIALREVVGHKLLKLATDGEIGALKMVLPFALVSDRLSLSPADVKAKEAEEEQRKILSARLVEGLEREAHGKKLGIIAIADDGRLDFAPWVIEAAKNRKEDRGRETGEPVAE